VPSRFNGERLDVVVVKVYRVEVSAADHGIRECGT
jgi:hypothetical protein